MATFPLAAKVLGGLGVVGVGSMGIIFRKEISDLMEGPKDMDKKFDELNINNCNFTKAKTECGGLTFQDLKKIFKNFHGKDISGEPNDGTFTLKIEEIPTGKDDWKFILTPSKSATLKVGNSVLTILKKSTKSEFRTTGKRNKYSLKEILGADVLAKIQGMPGKCKTGLPCKLNKTELSSLKFLTENNEKLEGVSTDLSDNNEAVTVTWEIPKSPLNYFSSPFEFTIKPIGSGKEIKIKKGSEDKITIPKTGIKLWLTKETEEGEDNKYYLSRELSEAGKESKVGLNCTTNPSGCQKAGSSIVGITTTSTNLTITKTSGQPSKYAISGDSNDNINGSYKIAYDGEKWTLEKEIAGQ